MSSNHLESNSKKLTKYDNQIFEDNHTIVKYLKESRLFTHLPPAIIDDIIPLASLKEFEAGDLILEEGIINDSIYLLISGVVGVVVRNEHILTLRRKGDIFGEMSVISDKPTTASVYAKSKATIIAIKAKDIVSFSETGNSGLRQVVYPIFAMILTDKLSLTTYKAQQYELTNKLLKDTKRALEEKIRQYKEAEANRKKIEKQLLQSQKMESLGTLAGGIAHDFNNILQGIILSSELANRQTGEDNPVKPYLERTLEFSNRAKELVSQILTFSRQKEVLFRRIDLTKLIDESVKMIRSSLPTTINFNIDLQEGLPHIAGDETQIQQIIVNLCSNAGYSMKNSGGTLGVEVKLSRFDIETAQGLGIQPGKMVKMIVSDTGQGIPAEIKDKIFDPFFTTKPIGDGTGLGLSVVIGIVQNHNGALLVDSEVGHGTSFIVYLPVIDVAEEFATCRLDKPHLKTARILLVDDEEAILMLHKESLEMLGYQITAFKNCVEAFNSFKADPDRFDLVLSDHTMPGMTGIQLMEKILEIRPDVPFILMTGQNTTVTREIALAKGAKDFILKPFSINDVDNTIQKVIA